MKISIITPTYNREKELPKLYTSIINNKTDSELEWLIMDDGSIDNTKKLIDSWINENKIQIIYKYQENKGKMKALNNITEFATGDVIIEIDSDDYFVDNAFKIIEKNYKYMQEDENIYAMIFPRKLINIQGKTIDKNNYKTTMFDLYFKEGLIGDTTLVFNTKIRKQYKHKLENNEKFITEARMYHEIDLKYKVLYFNENLCVSEYLEGGYSKNIIKTFKRDCFGYYQYFKEIFNQNMKNIKFNKRLYIIKHYILFSFLTKSKKNMKNIKGLINKLLFLMLYIPGILKTKIMFK